MLSNSNHRAAAGACDNSASNNHAWLVLSLFSGLKRSQLKALYNAFGSGKSIVQAEPEALASVAEISLGKAAQLKVLVRSQAFHNECQLMQQHGIDFLDWQQAAYPSALRDLPQPPWGMYVKGHLPEKSGPWIAVVGTRQHSEYGAQATQRLINEIAERAKDAVIVSGMALGIDTIAHKQALANGLKTVAVLGGGFGHLYPTQNKGLAEQIEGQGALFSEYGYHQTPRHYHFPQRNRIICALSDAVLVIEAGLKSGALITAELAIKYHKPLLAVAGNLDQPESEGVNQLIRLKQAQMVMRGQDVLNAIAGQPLTRIAHPAATSAPVKTSNQPKKGNESQSANGFQAVKPYQPVRATTQQAVSPSLIQPAQTVSTEAHPPHPVLSLLKARPHEVESLAAEFDQSIEAMLTTLLELELEGFVRRLTDGRYALAH